MTIEIRSDEQIKTDVFDELKWDPTIDGIELGVQVRSGVVTLTGTVNSYPKKMAARDAAHRVHGVLDVVDNTQVKIPTPWERTDEDVAKAVRSALQWDVLVPDERITSTVSAGIVTLQGNVDTWTQRANAERAVQRLTGVRNVVNQITITTKTLNPNELKLQIEKALERQAERAARRIRVAVQDGTVTLAGTLRSWGEKNAVERVVSYAPGVRRLDDNTVVDPYQ